MKWFTVNKTTYTTVAVQAEDEEEALHKVLSDSKDACEVQIDGEYSDPEDIRCIMVDADEILFAS